METKTARRNLLGSGRAETDRDLLENAFVETPEFAALVRTTDYSFVVGRRGTGKSELFFRTATELTEKGYHLRTIRSVDYETLAIVRRLENLGERYQRTRTVARLLWRIYITRTLLQSRGGHTQLPASVKEHEDSTPPRFTRFALDILNTHKALPFVELPDAIATSYDIERLDRLSRAEFSNEFPAIFIVDDLDEGWEPTETSTAILGGLAAAVAWFRDSQSPIHVCAYVRDNMFRALAHFDGEFSRNIVPHTLRLKWEPESLFNLTCQRIRAATGWKDESNSRVWNRFTDKSLHDFSGFSSSLRHTLHRPRDVIALVNSAYEVASKDGRKQITRTDMECGAELISSERLEDLLKEYLGVFPGLRDFVAVFAGGSAIFPQNHAVGLLGEQTNVGEACYGAVDFAVLGDPVAVLHALYSVGFIGIVSPTGEAAFVYDGSKLESRAVEHASSLAVHPCYWRALRLQLNDEGFEGVRSSAYDDYRPVPKEAAQDLRTRQLETALEEVAAIPEGRGGAVAFEEWVLRTVKILFGDVLSNIELHPNGDALQRRDIVGRNEANRPFWRQVYEDYGARQVVFEIKNYRDIGPDDYRQTMSYGGREYGRITFMVYRSEAEDLDPLTDNERRWVRELYYSRNEHLLVLVPVRMLRSCLLQQRKRYRPDYPDKRFSKLVDRYIRRYVQQASRGS